MTKTMPSPVGAARLLYVFNRISKTIVGESSVRFGRFIVALYPRHALHKQRAVPVFVPAFRFADRRNVATLVPQHVPRKTLRLHALPVHFNRVRHALFKMR